MFALVKSNKTKEKLLIIAYSLIYHLCLTLIKVAERKPFWEIDWYGTQFKIIIFKINENAQVHSSVQPPRWSGTKNKPNKFSFCFKVLARQMYFNLFFWNKIQPIQNLIHQSNERKAVLNCKNVLTSSRMNKMQTVPNHHKWIKLNKLLIVEENKHDYGQSICFNVYQLLLCVWKFPTQIS